MYDFSKKKQVPMYEEEDTDKNVKQETKKKGTGKKNMTKKEKDEQRMLFKCTDQCILLEDSKLHC